MALKKIPLQIFLSLALTSFSFSRLLAQTQTPVFTPTPGLSIVKIVNEGIFATGTTITYDLTINNFQTGTTENNLTVVDTLPPGFTIVSTETDITTGTYTVSPVLPVTGPNPVTFGSFSMANNTTKHIDLQVLVGSVSGMTVPVSNAATLFQNNSPVANSNALGQACAGVALAFEPTPGQPVSYQGNGICISPGSTSGYVVGNNGFIGSLNETNNTLTTQSSPTTQNLNGIDCCTGGVTNVVVGNDRTVLVNSGSGFISLGAIPFFEADNDPDDNPGSTDPDDLVNFTAIKIGPSCGGVYVTASDGAVLFCSSVANLINTNGGCLTPILGGGGPTNTTTFCGANSMDHLDAIDLTNDGWLLIGGYDLNAAGVTNVVFQVSNVTFPNSCTTFSNLLPGAQPVGSINAITHDGSGDIYAVGNNGQVYYSNNNETVGSPPTFTNLNAGGALGIPVTENLLSVAAVNANNVLIGGNHGAVYLFNGSGVQNLSNSMMQNKAVAWITNANGDIIGYAVVCEGTVTTYCLPPVPPIGPPSGTVTPTNTPTNTPSLTGTRTPPTVTTTITSTAFATSTATNTPTFTITSGPGTPGSPTSTQTAAATFTGTFTFTFTQSPNGTSGTGTPGSPTSTQTAAATFTGTPTFTITPNGTSGVGTGTVTTTPNSTSFSTDTPTPTISPTLTETGVANQNTLTPTPTPTPTSTIPVVDYHGVACISAGNGTFINLVVGDDGTLVERTTTGSGASSRVIPVVVSGVPVTVGFHAIFACTADEWWIVGANGTVVWTTDGGVTWNSLVLPGGTGVDLTDVKGNLGCSQLQIIGVGGQLWNVATNGTPGGTSVSGGTLGATSFGSAANCTGYAVPNPSDFSGGLLRFDKTFDFSSGGEQWIVGRNNLGQGFILHSSGSGIFCESSLPTTINGTAVNITEITDIFEQTGPPGSTNIWAVGNEACAGGTCYNVILHSTDDGRTWTSYPQLYTIPGLPNGVSNMTGINIEANTVRITTSTGQLIEFTQDPVTGAPNLLPVTQIGGTLTAVCSCVVCGLEGLFQPISDCSPFAVGGTFTFTPTFTPTYTTTSTTTNTPTLTPSGTFTNTFTPTYTFTVTNTFTISFTPTLTPTTVCTNFKVGSGQIPMSVSYIKFTGLVTQAAVDANNGTWPTALPGTSWIGLDANGDDTGTTTENYVYSGTFPATSAFSSYAIIAAADDAVTEIRINACVFPVFFGGKSFGSIAIPPGCLNTTGFNILTIVVEDTQKPFTGLDFSIVCNPFTPTVTTTFTTTPTNTPTHTATKTPTFTDTYTTTNTLTNTATLTSTFTLTNTPTPTATFTPTFTTTNTSTTSATNTVTYTATYTFTNTFTLTTTPTFTPSYTSTLTFTPTTTPCNCDFVNGAVIAHGPIETPVVGNYCFNEQLLLVPNPSKNYCSNSVSVSFSVVATVGTYTITSSSPDNTFAVPAAPTPYAISIPYTICGPAISNNPVFVILKSLGNTVCNQVITEGFGPLSPTYTSTFAATPTATPTSTATPGTSCVCTGWSTSCGITGLTSTNCASVALTITGTMPAGCSSVTVTLSATPATGTDTFSIVPTSLTISSLPVTVSVTVCDLTSALSGKNFIINMIDANGHTCSSCDPGIVPAFTPTPTFTPTISPTPALCGYGGVASPKVNLQVYCSQTDSQSRRWKVKILNEDSVPVTLSTLSIKMWFDQSGLVTAQWSGSNGTIYNSGGSTAGTINPPPNSAQAVAMSPPCVADSSHIANQVATLTFAGISGAIPVGGWVDGLEAWMTRCGTPCGNWDTPVVDYTQCNGTAYADDPYMAIYNNGHLLQEFVSSTVPDPESGVPPCAQQVTCTPTVTFTPTSTFTATRTFTITPTFTPTISPTPSPTANSTATAQGTATAQANATSTAIAAGTATEIAVATTQANETATTIAALSMTPTFTLTLISSPTATPSPTCPPACIFTPNQNSGLVIGQPNFTSNSVNQGLSNPTSQTLAGSQMGVFQAGNNLFVSDPVNNRVLLYNPVPTGNDPGATQVLGQSSFTGSLSNQTGLSASVTANTLAGPEGVWSNGTTLIVSDTNNNRVLIYHNISTLPIVDGSADVEIGQVDMVHSQANQGSAVGPRTLNINQAQYFVGVFYDGQRLFISDTGNNRVLIFNSLPVTNNAPADEVIGQSSFTNGLSQGSGPQGLFGPSGLWVSNGSLFVADSQNNRVLVYNNAGQGIDTLSEGTTNVAADAVVGQNSFTANAPSNAANGLNFPTGVYSNNCQLYIADSQNFRVVVYNNIPTGTTDPPADQVLGQPNLTTNTPPSSSQQNNLLPIDLQYSNGTLYVTDYDGVRVLGFTCANPSSPSPAFKGIKSSTLGGQSTTTPTPSQTPTITPTPFTGLLASAVVAPNVSRNGGPVKLLVNLGRNAQVHLTLYSLAGEEIYQTMVEGQVGLNSLLWNIQNSNNQAVASGLYVYLLQVDDGQTSESRTGNIAVLR